MRRSRTQHSCKAGMSQTRGAIALCILHGTHARRRAPAAPAHRSPRRHVATAVQGRLRRMKAHPPLWTPLGPPRSSRRPRRRRRRPLPPQRPLPWPVAPQCPHSARRLVHAWGRDQRRPPSRRPLAAVALQEQRRAEARKSSALVDGRDLSQWALRAPPRLAPSRRAHGADQARLSGAPVEAWAPGAARRAPRGGPDRRVRGAATKATTQGWRPFGVQRRGRASGSAPAGAGRGRLPPSRRGHHALDLHALEA